jgi:ABC-type spermidine/putrescine transport system permease subunit II
VFIPTVWFQRRLKKDRWGSALAKALVLGLVAAVPTSLTGTPVGIALLAWAGVDRWRR